MPEDLLDKAVGLCEYLLGELNLTVTKEAMR
jgi:hypothetical protein